MKKTIGYTLIVCFAIFAVFGCKNGKAEGNMTVSGIRGEETEENISSAEKELMDEAPSQTPKGTVAEKESNTSVHSTVGNASSPVSENDAGESFVEQESTDEVVVDEGESFDEEELYKEEDADLQEELPEEYDESGDPSPHSEDEDTGGDLEWQ